MSNLVPGLGFSANLMDKFPRVIFFVNNFRCIVLVSVFLSISNTAIADDESSSSYVIVPLLLLFLGLPFGLFLSVPCCLAYAYEYLQDMMRRIQVDVLSQDVNVRKMSRSTMKLFKDLLGWKTGDSVPVGSSDGRYEASLKATSSGDFGRFKVNLINFYESYIHDRPELCYLEDTHSVARGNFSAFLLYFVIDFTSLLLASILFATSYFDRHLDAPNCIIGALFFGWMFLPIQAVGLYRAYRGSAENNCHLAVRQLVDGTSTIIPNCIEHLKNLDVDPASFPPSPTPVTAN